MVMVWRSAHKLQIELDHHHADHNVQENVRDMDLIDQRWASRIEN